MTDRLIHETRLGETASMSLCTWAINDMRFAYKGPVIIYSQGGSGGNEGGDLKKFSLGKGGHPIILV